MASFLDKLHLLAMQGGNPCCEAVDQEPERRGDLTKQRCKLWNARSDVRLPKLGAGEFRRLTFQGRSNQSLAKPSPLLIYVSSGNLTVEEDCVRLSTYQRWHSHCVQCAQCGKVAAAPVVKEPTPRNGDEKESKEVTSRDQLPETLHPRGDPLPMWDSLCTMLTQKRIRYRLVMCYCCPVH